MQDALDKLAADIKATVVETCAKVAEIHAISRCENDFHRGYNDAIRMVAKKIRELQSGKAGA